MSERMQYYPNDSSHHIAANPYSQDDKEGYDDLIDQYATPYGKTSGHGTFAMDSSTLGLPQSQPYLSKPKMSYSSEHTSETHKTYDGSDAELHNSYPPKASLPADERSLWEKILPESLACRLYILTILVETTIDLAIEADILVRFHEADGSLSGRMPVYLSIFVLAHVFQFVVAVDAVNNRNTLQFISLTIFNALILIYGIVEISEINESFPSSTTGISSIPINILTRIVPIVIGVSQLIYMGLGWKIYNEFGWKTYKFLGADRRIKKMYANYQIFQCLIKFDVFFWVGFSVQFIYLVLQDKDWEYYVTFAALPLSIVLLVEGHLGAKHENKWMMITFMTGCTGALVYFLYKLIKLLSHTKEYAQVYQTLSLFSVIAIILLITTFVFSFMVLQAFGRGLKTQLAKGNEAARHNRGKSKGNGLNNFNGPLGAHPNRMSIE